MKTFRFVRLIGLAAISDPAKKTDQEGASFAGTARGASFFRSV
ncbi:hypothetical protein V2J23_11720 [Geobacillus thermoleovorans]